MLNHEACLIKMFKATSFVFKANNHDMNVDEYPDQIRRERDELQREVERLKQQLKDREATCNSVEDELLRIRRVRTLTFECCSHYQEINLIHTLGLYTVSN